MPMQRERYPANWEEISRRIRFERAGGKCEQCAAPHGGLIVRHSGNPALFVEYREAEDRYYWPDGTRVEARLSEFPEGYDSPKFVKVILTVHHIGIDKADGTAGDPHDKMDCRDENLIALCQRCHLKADGKLHADNARQTRIAKRKAQARKDGQLEMFS